MSTLPGASDAKFIGITVECQYNWPDVVLCAYFALEKGVAFQAASGWAQWVFCVENAGVVDAEELNNGSADGSADGVSLAHWNYFWDVQCQVGDPH